MRTLASIFFISSLLFFSCNNCNEKTGTQQSYNGNDLIPQKVVVKYEHNLIIPQETEIFSTISQETISDMIVSKTLNGSVKAYDAIERDQELSSAEINDIIGTTYDTLAEVSLKTFDTVMSVQKRTFDNSELQRLLFEESWSFNKEAFSFIKNVESYSPIRLFYRENDTLKKELLKQMLYWYSFDDSQKDKKDLTLLTENVTYEFGLYNNTNPAWLESLSPSRFVDILLDKVLEEGYPAYDFFSESNKQLSVEEIKENLGETIENYFIENPNTGEYDTVQVKSNFYPDELMSVIFIEDWYIDKDNLKIYKFVKKIAPVRQYTSFDEKGEEENTKRIPFYVNLK